MHVSYQAEMRIALLERELKDKTEKQTKIPTSPTTMTDTFSIIEEISAAAALGPNTTVSPSTSASEAFTT